MTLSADTALDSVAAAEGQLIDDPLELRLIAAFREAPVRARAPLVEIAEQLAASVPGVCADSRSCVQWKCCYAGGLVTNSD
jgi:hypothetical protein